MRFPRDELAERRARRMRRRPSAIERLQMMQPYVTTEEELEEIRAVVEEAVEEAVQMAREIEEEEGDE